MHMLILNTMCRLCFDRIDRLGSGSLCSIGFMAVYIKMREVRRNFKASQIRYACASTGSRINVNHTAVQNNVNLNQNRTKNVLRGTPRFPVYDMPDKQVEQPHARRYSDGPGPWIEKVLLTICSGSDPELRIHTWAIWCWLNMTVRVDPGVLRSRVVFVLVYSRVDQFSVTGKSASPLWTEFKSRKHIPKKALTERGTDNIPHGGRTIEKQASRLQRGKSFLVAERLDKDTLPHTSGFRAPEEMSMRT